MGKVREAENFREFTVIIKTFCAEGGIKETLSRPFNCRRTPLTRTLKGNEKQLAGNSSYQGKFQRNFDQGKGN